MAAAVAARGGASLDEVAAEARGALAMKAAQLGVPTAPRRRADSRARRVVAGGRARRARGAQRDRPARPPGGALRGDGARFDADVRVAKAGAAARR